MSDAVSVERARGLALPRFLTADSPVPWLLPITAMLTVFGLYPLGYSIWLSLHKRNVLTRQLDFAGGYQWVKAFSDARMWGALETTLLYTFVALALQLVLGILIALLLDTDRRGYGVLRAMMTLPLVVPPAVTGMMFLLMQDGSFGVLSFYLYALDLVSPARPLLTQPHTALIAVMLADIWQWTPFMVLIMLAGLRSLPKDPFEAAAIDGASAVQTFFRLTLPMLRKVIAVAVLIRGVDLFRIYDYVYIITAGGPGTATETLSFYAGRIYFTGDFSYAATLSLIIVVVLIGVSDIFVRLFKVRF
jgi:multiple sugar transport system permease protein